MEKILEITPGKFLMGVLSLVCIVSPGVLGINVYNPELFENIDIFKLILLSLSLSAPGFITFTTLSTLIFADNAEERIQDNTLEAMSFTVFINGMFSVLFMALYLIFNVGIVLLYKIYVGICSIALLYVLISTIFEKTETK